jgi:HK97 family phage major capsid protein
MANPIIEQQITAWRKIMNDMNRVHAQKNLAEAQRRREEMGISHYIAPPFNETFAYMPDHTSARGTASARYACEILGGIYTNFRTENSILSEGADPQGGYLLPDEWDARLIQKLESENPFRALASKEEVKGKRYYPAAESSSAAAWIAEGGSIPFSDMTFGQIVLSPHKLAVAVKVSEELMFDAAFDIQTYITHMFAAQLAKAEKAAFLTGEGGDRPTGIFHPSSGANVVLSAHKVLSADDIFNLVYSLKRPYRKNAVFILNDTTLRAMDALKDQDGRPLWQRDYASSAPGTILGYPLYVTDQAPTYAPNAAVMAFGDFSAYHIADCGRRVITRLDEAYASDGMVGFIGRERVDGKLLLPEAVSVLKMAE